MKRIATITKLKPDQKEEYISLHEKIWKDVVGIGHAANQRNFTIFSCGDYLFSYFEYIGEDYDTDMLNKKAQPVIQKWAKTTAEYLDDVVEGTRIIELEEVWHCDF